MAIQFQCPGCSQPIEVDDTHAGQTAACPYCRRVINVPVASTLEQSLPPTARPTGTGQTDQTVTPHSSPGVPPPLPSQPPSHGLLVGQDMTPAELASRSLGKYALVCAVIAVVLFAVSVVVAVSLMAPTLLHNPGSQPSPEEMAELQTQVAANPLVAGLQIGTAFFALVGVALSIASLSRHRTGNWKAIVSLIVCGLFTLCLCGGFLIGMIGGIGTAL